MNDNTASIRLFSRTGAPVTFTVSTEYRAELPAAANDLIALAQADGFSVIAPGLEEGEKYEDIAFVVRRAQIRDDGSEVPILDLYPEKLNFRFVSTYLDTPEQIAAFEQATGLTLSSLICFEGSAPIERGKNPRHDQKYVLRLPRPSRIVFRDNPRFEEGGTKPKRYFERWHAVPPTAPLAVVPKAEPSGSSATSPASAGASGNALPTVTVGADGKIPFGELFAPDEATVAKPEQVYPLVKALFNAEKHFSNWWEQHNQALKSMTVEEAVEYARDDHWYRDEDAVKQFYVWAGKDLNLTNEQIMYALNNVNEKPMSKVREWTGGELGMAKAALWAYSVNYDLQRLNNLNIDQQTRLVAAQWCEVASKKASA